MLDIGIYQSLLRKHFFVVCCAALLAGCMATSVESVKDKGYSKKIGSVVIWDTGGLSESYSTLTDRMGRTAESLQKIFLANNVKATVLSTKELELNKADRIRNFSSESNAELFLRLSVLKTRKRNLSAAVEFYDFEAVLVEVRSGKEVWKSIVHANFYSEPEAMATEIATLLAKAGLFELKTVGKVGS